MSKQAYVKQQTQNRAHVCHWPSCNQQVPPAMWGCKKHWFMLPKYLRDLVWAHYRPGQEIDSSPSQGYMDVMTEVYEWIYKTYPSESPQPENPSE